MESIASSGEATGVVDYEKLMSRLIESLESETNPDNRLRLAKTLLEHVNSYERVERILCRLAETDPEHRMRTEIFDSLRGKKILTGQLVAAAENTLADFPEANTKNAALRVVLAAAETSSPQALRILMEHIDYGVAELRKSVRSVLQRELLGGNAVVEAGFEGLMESDDLHARSLAQTILAEAASAVRGQPRADTAPSDGNGSPSDTAGSSNAAEVVGRTTSESIQLASLDVVAGVARTVVDATDDTAEKLVAQGVLDGVELLREHVSGIRELPQESLALTLRWLRGTGESLVTTYTVGQVLHRLGASILESLPV